MESSEHNGKSKIIFVTLSLLVAVSILPLGQFYLYSQEKQDTIKEQEYYIGIGDVLDISLWQIPDLSKPEVIVRPDGKISLPLISDVQAVGLTLTQLDEEITQRYTTYVRNPQVSVMIRQFGGSKVIVLGEVTSPGVYSFTGDIRIVEALALAGDCTKYAVRNNVLIIRGDIL